MSEFAVWHSGLKEWKDRKTIADNTHRYRFTPKDFDVEYSKDGQQWVKEEIRDNTSVDCNDEKYREKYIKRFDTPEAVRYVKITPA